MNKLILAGAAALAFAVPAGAQELAVTADGDVYVLSPTQKPVYDAWPLERRSGYDAWPNDLKVYYWTLNPTQQEGWWMLNDEQRTRLFAMTPEQRTQAWVSIERQMAGGTPSANASPTAQAATTAARTASTAGPGSVSTAVRATNPSDYPLCSATVTDSCINPREAGKNWGNRPLQHWPGQPASELKGKRNP